MAVSASRNSSGGSRLSLGIITRPAPALRCSTWSLTSTGSPMAAISRSMLRAACVEAASRVPSRFVSSSAKVSPSTRASVWPCSRSALRRRAMARSTASPAAMPRVSFTAWKALRFSAASAARRGWRSTSASSCATCSSSRRRLHRPVSASKCASWRISASAARRSRMSRTATARTVRPFTLRCCTLHSQGICVPCAFTRSTSQMPWIPRSVRWRVTSCACGATHDSMELPTSPPGATPISRSAAALASRTCPFSCRMMASKAASESWR